MMPMTSGRSSPTATSSSANTSVHEVEVELPTGSPESGIDATDRVELIGLVVAGRLVAAALLGDRVHDDRSAEVLGQLKGLEEHRQVVAVDGARGI